MSLPSTFFAAKYKVIAGVGDYTGFMAYLSANYNPQSNISNTTNFPNSTGTYNVNFVSGGAITGTMWGTSYGDTFTYDSTISRLMQHAFETEAVVLDYGTNGRTAYVEIQSAGDQPSVQLNRNGYTSSSYGGFPSLRVVKCVYWDNANSVGIEVDPYNQSTYAEVYP